MGEIIGAVDEGTLFDVADRALNPLGLPMSPLTLLQLVGPAIAQHVNETMHAAYPERFGLSENLQRFVEQGKTAVWTADEQGNQVVDPEVADLWQQGDRPSSEEQVRQRALRALAEEARIMLDEDVVVEAPDLDLCMILGAGWPLHLGGITPYLDDCGAAERVNGTRFHG